MECKALNAAIISGAGSGMGRAAAERLAGHGVKIVCLDRDEQAANATAKALDGYPLVADVTSAADIEQGFLQAVKVVGDIRACINCAGIAPGARMVGREGPMPLEDFSQAIHVNLIGTFNVMRVASAHMAELAPVNIDQEQGVIINTASVAAFDGQIGQTAYSASKGGIVAMTLPAARELTRFGIRVMAIAPGIINTPMMQGLPVEAQASLAEQVPFPKRLGHADEFAQLVQHIIQNAYLNAEVIRMDGGIRMQAK